MDRAQSKAEDGIWIAPDRLKETYCFSDDTRSRGIAVLEGTGVVYISRQPVNEDFGYRRVRNAYSIDPTILSAPVEAARRVNGRSWLRSSVAACATRGQVTSKSA